MKKIYSIESARQTMELVRQREQQELRDAQSIKGEIGVCLHNMQRVYNGGFPPNYYSCKYCGYTKAANIFGKLDE